MKKVLSILIALLLVGVIVYFAFIQTPSPRFGSTWHTYLGLAAEKLTIWGFAVNECSLAVKADPKNVTARRGLAMSYLGGNRYDEAIRQFNQALSQDKKWAKGYLGRARACEGKKDFRGAIASYRLYLESSPDLAGPTRRLIEQKIQKLNFGL